jgi:segregation and condensation protein B
MSLKSEIESLLFVSTKPLSLKRLVDVTGHSKDEVKAALDALIAEHDARPDAGMIVLRNGDEVQMATAPDHAEMIKTFLKDESFGELTRPALETLTIVAYRGPLTKPELEQIRGVNCSLILRNLMIRGLVEQDDELFKVTFDFIRHLGLRDLAELPDFEALRSEENLKKLLETNKQNGAPAAQ